MTKNRTTKKIAPIEYIENGLWNCCIAKPEYALAFDGDGSSIIWCFACANCAGASKHQFGPERVHKLTSQQRRFGHIRRVTGKFIDLNNPFSMASGITVKAVCDEIETLREYGRTERWDLAVTRWKNLVHECRAFEEGSDEYLRRMNLALLQGNINTGHTA